MATVRTFLVAGGGKTAGSQRAYSLGSCVMGHTNGRTDRRTDRAIPKCPPLVVRGHNNKCIVTKIRAKLIFQDHADQKWES